jgi:ankyrin repeat protein
VRYGNYRDVEQKLEEGLPVESRGGQKNGTLLCEAACHGHHRIAKLLLRNKADINAQNSQGNTPLHLAMEFNYKKLADYLAEKGAKINIRNKKGLTAHEMEDMQDPDAEMKEGSPNAAIRGGGRS